MNQRRFLFEWIMSFAMLGVGIHTLVWPGSLPDSRAAPVLAFLPEPMFALLCLLAASVKIIGLYFEGRFGKWNHMLRAGGATFGFAMLVQIFIALILAANELRIAVTPLIWFYGAFAVGELFVIIRARSDARPY